GRGGHPGPADGLPAGDDRGAGGAGRPGGWGGLCQPAAVRGGPAADRLRQRRLQGSRGRSPGLVHRVCRAGADPGGPVALAGGGLWNDMGIDRLKRVLLCLGAALWLALAAPAVLGPALAPKGQAVVPGHVGLQPYLEQAPARLEDCASDALGTVRALVPGDVAGTMRASVAGYAQVLLFLLLVVLLSFFVEEGKAGLL